MIYCVGVGPGDLGFLTRRGQDLIEGADVVAGFTAVADLVRSLVKPDARVITMGYKARWNIWRKLHICIGLDRSVWLFSWVTRISPGSNFSNA